MISDYPYAEYFRDHNREKDMIIVNRSATVTPYPGGEPTISGADILFTTGDIKIESFDLEEALCSEDDLQFGVCSSAQVKVTVINKTEYPNLKDEVLKIYIYFDGDSGTLFQIGQYMVESDAYSDDRRFRDLSMFDLLYHLRDYDITEWYNAVYADNNNQPLKISVLVNSLMNWLETTENLPLDHDTLSQFDYTIPKNITADNITFDFFTKRIFETLGIFGHIDRTGRLVYKKLEWYDKPAVRTIPDEWRKPPTTWKDQYTWGVGQIDVYDENNILKFQYRNTNKKRPSTYTIVDSFVFSSRKSEDAEALALLEYMWNQITHIRYKPYEVECIGDLCVEVGDRIDIQCGDVTFYTYVLERRLTGIQSMRDTYSAKGNKKQPKYKIDNGNYDNTSEGNSGIGSGGVSYVENTFEDNFYEYIRNIGLRALDKPSNVICEYDAENGEVNIAWTDPDDISTNKPVAVAWAGTIVVRRENSVIRHIWDGEPDIATIVNETTKNTYSQSYLTDNTVEENKQYYYGIFPYDTNGHYGKPTIISVNTNAPVMAATISNIEMSGYNVVVTYEVPESTYSYIKLVYKKDSIPTNYADGTAIDITQSSTSQTIGGLADGGKYWFVIFTDKTTSEAKNFTTPALYTLYELKDITREKTVASTNSYRTSGFGNNPNEASGTYYAGSNRFLVYYSMNDSGINTLINNYLTGKEAYLASNTYTYIRVDRVQALRIEFEGRMAVKKNAGYDTFNVRTSYMNNPSATRNASLTVNDGVVYNDTTIGTNWKTYTLEYASPVNVDYIVIGSCDGRWEFRDFKVYGVANSSS